MKIVPVNDDFPPGFYEEFARLVIAFGRLDYLIKLCVKDLSAEGFTRGMLEAESQVQFCKLCEKAKERAGQSQKLSQTQTHDFSELIDQAEVLADFRNDTVHALWTTKNGQSLRIRPKLVKVPKSVDWSRGRVVLLNEIHRTRRQIERLYQDSELQRKTWHTYVT
jgi:hypothetical protein